jgi:replicative DNA helicase
VLLRKKRKVPQAYSRADDSARSLNGLRDDVPKNTPMKHINNAPPLLPTNPEAETAILGAILLDNACFNQAAAAVSEEDFSLDSNRRIFRAITALIERGARVDYVTLTEQLQSTGELKHCGGAAYVTSLTDGLPRVKNIAQYARIVKEKARSRMLINACSSAQGAACDGAAPDEVLAQLQQNVIEIFHHGRGSRTPPLPELARESLEQMHRVRTMKSRCVGLTTGIAQLDEMTTGFRAGEFYVIGARPGCGKTALACQAVRANCLAGVKCALFSVEMTGQQIIQRLAAMETGVDLFDLRDPRNLNQSEMSLVAEAVSAIAHWPLLIEDSGRISIKEIGALARMFISQGAEIIFVDYLQRVKALGKTDFDRVTAVSEALCELAKSTQVPVVALSQLRRTDRRDITAEPSLEDLRQSGQIEQDAHAVFLLHRPKGLQPGPDGKSYFTGEDKIIIAKQRSGPAGTHVKVRFNGAMGVWEER